MNINRIQPDWHTILQDEFQKPYFKALTEFVEQEYASKICFPPEEDIFAAFDYCSFDNLKVVILGQDPYPGIGQADGLCFSVNEDMAFPRSLQNIFKEIETDLAKEFPVHGNLQSWAKQGVLLLNAILTVRAGEAGSHQRKGWEKFTDAVIAAISQQKDNVVFLLWGGYAKNKGKKIDGQKHLILESGHPSPLSANRGFWFGNKHFSQTNNYLKSKGNAPIDW